MTAVSTFKDLLKRYAEGDRDFVGSELDSDPDNDLSGVTLDGADLSKSWIIASFCRARLRDVKFREGNVKTCDFSQADLTDADLTDSALCATTFNVARLDKARFEGASYHSHKLQAGELPNW